MVVKKLVLSSLLPLFLYSMSSHGGSTGEPSSLRHPFYIGVQAGYGSTTWQGLVPTLKNQNVAINMSTPIEVKEGGGTWGAFAGYEFMPALAVELNYLRYPNARVLFDALSLFSFENNDQRELNTQTQSINLMGKIMLFIPNTRIRIYSGAGVGVVHRNDILLSDWHLGPTFGVGANAHLSEHFMAELAGNYTAGYGESQLSPTNTYFPFVYSVVARLAYCF